MEPDSDCESSGEIRYGYLGYSEVTKEILDGICLEPDLVISFTDSVEEDYGRYVDFGDYSNWVKIDSINSDRSKNIISGYDIDILLVMGWPELLDKDILHTPNLGCVGRHLSLLPQRRGRAPVPWALIHGLHVTGVSFFWLNEGIDSGPIIEQVEVPIDYMDHAQDLHDKCTESSIYTLNDDVLPKLEDTAELTRENVTKEDLVAPSFRSATAEDMNMDSEATYTHPRRPDMGLIDWENSSGRVHNFIRGQSHPYPGAFTYLGMDKIKVWRSEPKHGSKIIDVPGTVLETSYDYELEDNEWVVQCGEGFVQVEMENVGSGDFQIEEGVRLGQVNY